MAGWGQGEDPTRRTGLLVGAAVTAGVGYALLATPAYAADPLPVPLPAAQLSVPLPVAPLVQPVTRSVPGPNVTPFVNRVTQPVLGSSGWPLVGTAVPPDLRPTVTAVLPTVVRTVPGSAPTALRGPGRGSSRHAGTASGSPVARGVSTGSATTQPSAPGPTRPPVLPLWWPVGPAPVLSSRVDAGTGHPWPGSNGCSPAPLPPVVPVRAEVPPAGDARAPRGPPREPGFRPD
jgi:hypothetical protein